MEHMGRIGRQPRRASVAQTIRVVPDGHLDCGFPLDRDSAKTLRSGGPKSAAKSCRDAFADTWNIAPRTQTLYERRGPSFRCLKSPGSIRFARRSTTHAVSGENHRSI